MSKEIVTMLPLLTAIVSAIIAYFFGKVNEKNKKHFELVKESIEEYYSEIYRKCIDIYYNGNKIDEIKDLIIEYYEDNGMYKVYNYEIQDFFLEWGIKIKNGAVFTDTELKKEFKKIAMLIQKEYWYRLQVYSKDLFWFIKVANSNRWFIAAVNIVYYLKNIVEYFTITCVVTSLLVISDFVVNDEKSQVFPNEIRLIVIFVTFLAFILYLMCFALYHLVSINRISKHSRNFFN